MVPPDPLCCQGYKLHHNVPFSGGGGSRNKLRLSAMFPEPVCQVYLQRQISVSEYNNLMMRSTAAIGNADTSTCLENFPPLKLGILFMPHNSLEDPESSIEGSAIEAN